MILLELSFEYDTESKLIGTLLSDNETLGSTLSFRVMGISVTDIGHGSAKGGMVRAFYESADERVRGEATTLEEFRVNLHMAFRVAAQGGRIDPLLTEWLHEIDPYIEDNESGRAIIKPGTSIRFYRPDGPRGSWVWKDTIKEVKAILDP